MAGWSTAERFDALATTTLNIYASKTLQDQVFNADPLWAALYARNRKEKYLKGGQFIEVPLMYAKNETGMTYSGLDPLDVSSSEGLGNAIFPWRLYNIAITVSGEELAKNQGDAAVIDLLKAKIKQAQMSMEDDLSTMLYGAGTGTDLFGLQAIVGTGSLAGIDGATYTWWQSKTDTSSTSMDTGWMTSMVLSVRGSGASGNTGNLGIGRCDLIVMPQDLYAAYEALVAEKYQTQETKLGQLGFEALKFKGAEVTWSEKCPQGTVYFLSTDHIALKVHPERDFKVTPFQEPVNQDGRVAHIRLMGNLVTDRRNRLGVATNKTA